MANKILSVGSTKRAMLLSEFLDHSEAGAHLLEVESDRGFLTITGGSSQAASIFTLHDFV